MSEADSAMSPAATASFRQADMARESSSGSHGSSLPVGRECHGIWASRRTGVNLYAELDVISDITETAVHRVPRPSGCRNETSHYMNSVFRKSVLAGIAGLSLAGTAAGMRPGARPRPQRRPPPPRRSATSGSAAAGGASAAYKDGTYSADGNYVSPNGTETVGVELTLADGAVSGVQITPHPSNPNTRSSRASSPAGSRTRSWGRNWTRSVSRRWPGPR